MSNNEKQENKKNNFNIPWVYLSLILVCAIVAGIFGQTLSSYFVKDIYSPYSYYNEIDLGNLTAANPSLIIRDPKMVVVNQDVKFSETVLDVKSSLLGVFEKIYVPEIANKLLTDSGESGSNYSYYYNLKKPLLVGFIITADGWVVAPVESGFNFKAEDLIVIDNNRKVYELSDLSLVNEDGLVFFRLADGRNLLTRKNMLKSEFFLGQSFLAIKDLTSVKPLNLISLSENEDVLSSEGSNFNLNFSLSSDNLKNSFIFNLAGDLAAIINSKAELIPASSYSHYFNSLVENTSLTKVYFGVNYLNLSEVKIAGITTDINKGALLFSDGKKEAVLKNSPADKAGLKENDIITWVNNKEINKDNDLAEIINSFKPGDKLRVSYLRKGVESSIEVILDSKPLEKK